MPNKYFSEENKERQEEKAAADKEEHIKEAFEQAEKDLEQDPDMKPGKNEDLDEGELARKENHP